MENNDKVFAIIEDGIVINAIVGPAMAIVQGLLPDADLVEVTEATGLAFIDGSFLDGTFIPPKRYESWTLDTKAKVWKAPVKEPSVEPGFYLEWNEENLKWEIKEILITTESE